MNILDKMFPRVPSRLHRTDKFWNGKKKPFAIAVVASSLLLQILFLLNICYLFGSLFKVTHRTHNLNVLMVNYDEGLISHALESAVGSLKADAFIGVQGLSPAVYSDPASVYNAVRNGDYWAGVYTHSGASQRLSAALGGGTAAKSYNTTDVISYVFNEARYAAPSDGYLKSQLEQLVQVTRVVYNHMNGTGALEALNQKDPVALQVLLNPWQSNAINIQPTTQGDRVLYNTAAMVFPIIMQFFCLMAINGISAQFNLYSHLPILDNAIIRNTLAAIFTFIGALCLAGAVWAFKEGWPLGGGQFMCLWLIYWLYMHINFLVMDVATAFIPMKMLPFFVFTWVIVNVTSTIFPFELSPGFYRIGYAFPAHEVWQVVVQIFTGGAPNRLYQALPVLFAYEIVLLPFAKIAMHHRCMIAARAEQEQEEEDRLAREEAYAEERRREMETSHGEDEDNHGFEHDDHHDDHPGVDEAVETTNEKSHATVEEKTPAVEESSSSNSNNENDDENNNNNNNNNDKSKLGSNKVIDRMHSFRSLRSAGGARGIHRSASQRSTGGDSTRSLRRSDTRGSQRSARDRLAQEYWPSVPVPFSSSYTQPEQPIVTPPMPPPFNEEEKVEV